MKLENVESNLFAMLVGWMYQGKIFQGANERIVAVELAKLWTLADRFLMPKLQNAVMDKLGCPDDGFKLSTRDGKIRPGEVISEFIEYVGMSADNKTPLGRYCVRLLLYFLHCEKALGGKMADLLRMRMYDILGNGVAIGVITALMEMQGLKYPKFPAGRLRTIMLRIAESGRSSLSITSCDSKLQARIARELIRWEQNHEYITFLSVS